MSLLAEQCQGIHALVDADIILYEFGSCVDERGQRLKWPFVAARVDSRINHILTAVGAESHELFLTGEGNFRLDVATIRKYKGNRVTEKPYYHAKIKKFLLEHRGAQLIEGMEADDAMSIAQYADMDILGYCRDNANTVICSRDKDLHMVPGWHYSWGAGRQKEQPLWWQDQMTGLKCFYKQILTGDAVDNIPGLYRVGKASSLMKRIDVCESELSMYTIVKEEYIKYFGSYWQGFFEENARLLWMLREEGEVWKIPTKFLVHDVDQQGL